MGLAPTGKRRLVTAHTQLRTFLEEDESKHHRAGQNSHHRENAVVTLKSPPFTVWHFAWTPFINACAERYLDNAVILFTTEINWIATG